MKINNIVGEATRIIQNLAPTKKYETGHSLYLPLGDSHKYDRNSPDCSPNSVFKVEMLAIREVQDAIIGMVSLFPLAGKNKGQLPSAHVWNAERVRDDCVTKQGK